MTRTRTRAMTLGLLIPLALARPGLARDDAPQAPKPSPAAEAARAIVPGPPQAIPDDPPPHEGALIDVPYLIEPPDILVVEALEALPGRPITGERLVRLDGTISLGFYGDVHVRGLTAPQAKAKILHHLREFLTDEALGLVRFRPAGVGPVDPLPAPGTERPMTEEVAPDRRPFEKPDVTPPGAGAKPEAAPPAAPPEATKAAAKATSRQARRADRRGKRARVAAAKSGEPLATYAGMQDPTAKPAAPPAGEPAVVAEPMPPDGSGEVVEGHLVSIDPKDSDRVMVDVAKYSSKVYYVQGDVGSPGRLPITGNETVLDALTFAGGLIPTAEKSDIHLHRPARGGKPARDYPVDLAAIHRGDVRANLQLFDGDRLVVGRNAVVQRTIEIDRAAAPFGSIVNSAMQYGFLARSLGAGPGLVNEDQTRRDAAIRKWVELFWNLPGGKADGLDPVKLQGAVPSPAAAAPAGGLDVKLSPPK